MEPSSSCVEYHDFLDVFLQQFSFNQKAECHVQESSGKDVKRRFGSGEPETVSRNLLSMKQTPPQELSASNSLGSQELDQNGVFQLAAGSCCATATKTQQRILKRGNKMTLYLPATGNWSEVMTCKSEGQGWNSTVCKSPTIDTLRKC